MERLPGYMYVMCGKVTRYVMCGEVTRYVMWGEVTRVHVCDVWKGYQGTCM